MKVIVPAYYMGYTEPMEHMSKGHAAVVLNEYQLANLRWLLRHVVSGTVPPYTNTGDWAGEVCWTLEQALKDLHQDGSEIMLPNVSSDVKLWPYSGWFDHTTLRAELFGL